ncbi:transcriptional regulator [Mammaliicoccus sciuri]|uniref:TetR/AcrR family transcriptional regulator n=1 Tax=Mammaliicoccus sciuri TaxID=1296 RepID=UPI000733EC0B|nr:TetR/AcrR family transcriptional regulator [Mammaliicoccus sciuri]KTT83198.1 transcriptional regulator [Mammaliicoccus sciuri]KTT86723.1 transcriptional regulator [Mammaliicoccus sciuri]KTT92235.1 transcriptional regulator [Mammaliicoccus sciuri]KTT94365.1 transcriptional regulator [Mammaliicoccus sciuri]KTW13217.1 transcriptional regulator [Mammaliicoccus sciuri]
MDLRIVKTRKIINENFLELFNTTGFDNITVKNITDKAQIGRKTFYLHYLDKFDLLDSIVDKKLKELEDICKSKTELGLKEGTRIWFDYFEDNKSFFNQLFNIQTANQYKKQLQIFIVNELKYKVDTTHTPYNQSNHELSLHFFASGIIELITIFLTDNSFKKEDIEFQVVYLMEMFTKKLS